MGLFQGKKEPHAKTPEEAVEAEVEQLFDDAFREEMRTNGRLYFERIMNENAALFKQDLDATVAHINTELRQHVARQLDDQFSEITKVNTELRQHVAKQLDDQFAEYTKSMKDAQELALQTLNKSAQALGEQHAQLGDALKATMADQEALVAGAAKENTERITTMKDTLNVALQSLNRSAQELEEQHQQIRTTLQKSIMNQEQLLISAFEDNMATIIEHYLLSALGDQYDLKAQLPAIIKQMEADKQAIADDMKL